MARIQVLNAHVANQIAAGEVVERPSSVVKELVENAVDANATAISIEIENGGIDLIRITDNGSGIPDEDTETAFLRHATSKISSSDDLTHIGTLGFRGEALASIAAVARVTLTTRTVDEEMGSIVRIEGGNRIEHRRIGCVEGTTILVKNLFYNTPARLKFLKSARSEAGAIGDLIARLILALPHISFQYSSNGKIVYHSTGDGNLKNALIAVYGVAVCSHLVSVSFDDGYMAINGYVGTPELSRPNRTAQTFIINDRIIHSNALSSAVSHAFDTRMLIGRYPFCVLSIRLSPAEVDVNVHPSKLEVRFANTERVTRSIIASCGRALASSYIPSIVSGQSGTIVADAEPLDKLNKDPEVSHLVELRTPIPQSTYAVREPASNRNAFASQHNSSVPESNLSDIVETHTRLFEATSKTSIPRYTISSRTNESKPTLIESYSEQEAPFTKPFFVIGCAFSAYWFVQQGNDIFCIDQHAAHERLLYDELMQKKATVISQTLLLPEKITLLPSDRELLHETRSELEEFGFAFSESDDGELLITAVPQLNGVPLKSMFLLDVLHGESVTRATLTQQACKHAIKAGESITRPELMKLLEAYQDTDTLLTCPHGRPVAIRISKNEVEKWFKRVL